MLLSSSAFFSSVAPVSATGCGLGSGGRGASGSGGGGAGVSAVTGGSGGSAGSEVAVPVPVPVRAVVVAGVLAGSSPAHSRKVPHSPQNCVPGGFRVPHSGQ